MKMNYLQLNVQVPKDIAKISKANGIFLIYISTDYVFDGTQPPYHAIGGKPNPLNFYGRTKLAGEKAIEEVYPEATILRVPILYVGEKFNSVLCCKRNTI
jgi:S-adenosylmethionine synthetase